MKGIYMGADDFVVRPFHFLEMQMRIQNLIQSRKMLQQIYSKTTPATPVANMLLGGLDQVFAEIIRIVGRLEFPPLVVFYYEHLTREVCEAFSGMDGTVSPKENRFIQYLLRQVGAICKELHSSGAGGAAVPEGVKP